MTRPKTKVDVAMKELLQAARASNDVRPVEDGFLGLSGLSIDDRYLLGAFSLYIKLREQGNERLDAAEADMLPAVENTPEPLEAKSILQTNSVSGQNSNLKEPSKLGSRIQDESEQTPRVVDLFSEQSPFKKVNPSNSMGRPEFKTASDSLAPQQHAGSGLDVSDLSRGGITVSGQELVSPSVQESADQALSMPLVNQSLTTLKDTAEILTKTVYLKNAKMNEPYSEVIDVVGFTDYRIIDDGGSGLAFDDSSRTLNGTPSKSGDFVFKIQGLMGRLPCDLYAKLAVIPDPRSLWISKPHDSTAPFAKEDEDSGVSRGDLLCVAASKRGRSHAREGLFRDDDFALWTGGPGGWNIAVVADGAGSAKYSRRGSQIAVRTIVRDLPSLLEEQLTGQIDGLVAEYLKGVEGAEDRIRTQLYLSLATAAFNAAKTIGDEAARAEERAGSFSTTLVLSVARPGPHGWVIAGFSFGDGGAAIFDLPTRTVKTLTLADSGEFAGQTRFLQQSEFAAGYEEVAKRLFFDVRHSFTAVLAMTDGITDPKFPTDSAFANSDVWSSFWETDLSKSVLVSRENTALERELLAWLDFWSPGNHDDRTIAIMLP